MLYGKLVTVVLGCFLIGSTTVPPVENWLDPTARLTAIGVLSLIVGWLLMKTVPAFLSTMKEMNKQNCETLDKISQRQHEDSNQLQGVLRDVISHCSKKRD